MTWQILIVQGNEIRAGVAVTPNVEREIDYFDRAVCAEVAKTLVIHSRMEPGFYELTLIDENGCEHDNLPMETHP